MIYVLMSNGEQCMYKIGYSRDSVSIKSRIRNLLTASAYNLSLVSTFDGDMSDERKIHRILKKYNYNREWFSAHPSDAWFSNFIEMLCIDGVNFLNSDYSEIGEFFIRNTDFVISRIGIRPDFEFLMRMEYERQ